MSELIGRVILIAGAPGTAGLGVAEEFRAQGATVVMVSGPEGDDGDPGALKRRCDAILTEHGRLDLIIFCSGTALPPDAEAMPASHVLAKPRPLLERWGAKLLSLL